jgi:hypothetical protein
MKCMLLIFLAFPLTVLPACSTTSSDHPEGRKQSEVDHGRLASVLTLEKEAETAVLRASFTVRNQTEETLVLTFNSGQQYDFWLLDGAGATLWQWSEDKMFTMAIVERRLGPEPWVYEEAVPLRTREGDPLPDGTYSVRARLAADRNVENQVSFSARGGEPVL